MNAICNETAISLVSDDSYGRSPSERAGRSDASLERGQHSYGWDWEDYEKGYRAMRALIGY